MRLEACREEGPHRGAEVRAPAQDHHILRNKDTSLLCNCMFSSLQTHYVISEGQTELEAKQPAPQSTTQTHTEHLEQQPANQQATTQYIITTTTNGNGTSEVHITKP